MNDFAKLMEEKVLLERRCILLEQQLAALKAQAGGVALPGVLAECFFHDLPDEDDWEVHDPRHMSGDCDGCVQAVIVSRADWGRLNQQPASGCGPVFDLDASAWEQIKEAASQSAWMPEQYFMNDWVSDVCRFLREPRIASGGVDERAAFEEWYSDAMWGNEDFKQSIMRAWQARAALAQSERVPEGKVLIDRQVVDFLQGKGELRGMHFGDRLPGMPAYWWRAYLPKTAAPSPSKQGGV